jgi:GTP-binding protein HflX
MTKMALIPTSGSIPRALLVGVELRSISSMFTIHDSLDELEQLANTGGMSVVGRMYQKLSVPNSSTYIGIGKLAELIELIEITAADIVLFDSELSPRHQRELEKIIGDSTQILDRTALILYIFANNAKTREGGLQVELAQYEYRLPRLTRQWKHLARQAGGASGRTGSIGGVGLRGPGEKQLEVDRREITRRITKLKKELQKVRTHRSHHRKRRQNSKVSVVAMVGYTNTGKSTLLSRLSDTDILIANRLFATLDPTTRRITWPGGRSFLLTDTVGFIQKLPSTVIAAFRATLEEIEEADLLLHVIDVTHKCCIEQAHVVMKTLDDIGVSNIPIITVLNKTDLLIDMKLPDKMYNSFPDALPISGISGYGIPKLVASIQKYLKSSMVEMTVSLPYRNGDLISIFHKYGIAVNAMHGEESVKLSGELPVSVAQKFWKYRCQ